LARFGEPATGTDCLNAAYAAPVQLEAQTERPSLPSRAPRRPAPAALRLRELAAAPGRRQPVVCGAPASGAPAPFPARAFRA